MRNLISFMAMLAVAMSLPSAAFANNSSTTALQQSGVSADFTEGPGGLGIVHQSSNIFFPESFGDFRLIGTQVYGVNNVSVRYQLSETMAVDGEPWCDLFVYHSPLDIEESQKNLEQVIATAMPDIRWIRDIPPPANAPNAKGRIGKATMRGVNIETAYIIMQVDGWEIKMRASVIGKFDKKNWAKLQALIDNFAWAPQRAQS